MLQRLMRLALLAVIVAGAVVTLRNPPTRAARDDKAPELFARTTIDLGVVVSDVDKAAAFYTKAIGFQEVKGFSVDSDFCTDAGLTDGKALKIRVFVLGEGASATKLKLMQVAGSKKNNNQFVNSEQGFRYLTIYVTDMNESLKRLKKAGVAPLAKGPVAIPEKLVKGAFLTVVRDPDGNLIELAGPKK